MISFVNLILFALAVIGLTNILVDPATIAKPFRDFVEKYCFSWLNKLFSCYQCCGTWVGFICGYVLISKEIFIVIMCGFAGSFIATWGVTYLNYLEAKSIVDIENEQNN